MEEILKLLEMDTYADAVVGKTGEGLNVEERKRLSIGVEMVAKPELLLFLDEPSRSVPSSSCSRLALVFDVDADPSLLALAQWSRLADELVDPEPAREPQEPRSSCPLHE